MSSQIQAPGAPGPRAWWRGLAPGHRRALRILLTLGVLLVLAISGLLARFLTVENAERSDALALLAAEARGDLAGMLVRLDGCRQTPSCLQTERANATNPRLQRSGEVKIVQLESPTSNSLFGATGKTRVAWTVIGRLPIVQCVEVRRTGNFLTGIHVALIGLSAPIENEGKCRPATTIEKEEEEDTAVER